MDATAVVPPRLLAAILLIVAIPVTVAVCRWLQHRGVLDRFQANVVIAAAVVMVGLGLTVVALVDRVGSAFDFD